MSANPLTDILSSYEKVGGAVDGRCQALTHPFKVGQTGSNALVRDFLRFTRADFPPEIINAQVKTQVSFFATCFW